MIERLETERMVLRPITMDDADLLVGLDSDPAVMRFISGGTPSTRDEVEQRFADRSGIDGLRSIARPASSSGGSLCGRSTPAAPTAASAIASARPRGVAVSRPKVREH